MKLILAALALSCAVTPGLAQPYDAPPPGYYPDRPREYDRDRPDYDRDRPPPGYYRDRRVEIGRHCEAFARTEYGPRRLFCRIVDPKPVGDDCACPLPAAGPGYPPGPFVGGRTVP